MYNRFVCENTKGLNVMVLKISHISVEIAREM